jgi:predicted transcriptional regulator
MTRTARRRKMANMATSEFKEQAHQLVDSLPETADWDDLIEKARYLAAVQRGIEAADRGDFASAERVRAMFAKWGVDVEG